jgi:uncharacterized protein
MLYEMTVPQFSKMLRNLSTILSKAAAYADAKKIDVNVLMQSRLYPDQFNLAKQIQVACDTAKLCASRLSGKDVPTHDDNLMSFVDIKSRLEQVVSYLNTYTAKDFAGAEKKNITTPRWEGKSMTAQDYVVHHAIPNVYFHITTAYAILRHNGVEIGKKDYLGDLPFKS